MSQSQLIICLCIALGIAHTQPSIAQVRDNKDYCIASNQLVLVLIDVTTPYDQVDKDAIGDMVNHVFTIMNGGDKLIMRTIADSHTRSERLIERCIPHCSASGAVERLFKCSDGLIKTDLELVRSEVVQKLKGRLLHFEELRYSDIVRTIVTIAREDGRASPRLRLYVFSDLIENADYFPGGRLFRQSNPALLEWLRKQSLIATLPNAQVRVAGVGRAGVADRRPLTIAELNKLEGFWRDYFRAAGATSVEIGQNLPR